MTAEDRIQRLLAQADLLLLLARLFSRPSPDRSQFEVDPESVHNLLLAAGIDEVDPEEKALMAALQEARTLETDAWEREYTRLFDGAGVCPMNETVFVRRDKGAILADIAGFYRGFRWEASVPGEKLDYLVTEMEFTAVLLVTLADVETRGNSEGAAVATGALEAFLADHLGEWLLSFCDRVEASTTLTLFTCGAAALRRVGELLLAGYGVPINSSPVDVDLSPVDEDSYFPCGPMKGNPGL